MGWESWVQSQAETPKLSEDLHQPNGCHKDHILNCQSLSVSLMSNKDISHTENVVFLPLLNENHTIHIGCMHNKSTLITSSINPHEWQSLALEG